MDQSARNYSSPPKRTRQCGVLFTSEGEEVLYPLSLSWICVRCTNSCRDMPRRRRKILLVRSDITRITGATRLGEEEFSTSSCGPAPYVRMMKKLKGACIFLQGSRCSVYQARPLICRFYPFSLRPSGDGRLEIGFDSACSGVGKGPTRNEKFFQSLVKLAEKELLLD